MTTDCRVAARHAAAIRTTARDELGVRPTVAVADQLLDERLVLMRTDPTPLTAAKIHENQLADWTLAVEVVHMTKQYFQCRLRNADQETTGWIEARAAKVGASVELLPSHEFWEVVEVFGHRLAEDMLKQHQHMHRKSLPSIIGS